MIGVFISFSEGMNQCLNRSLAVAVLALTCLAVSLARTSQASSLIQQTSGIRPGNATETLIDYTTNDLLLGSADTFFWFLIPMFGLICYGICTIANWFILLLINIFALVYGRLKSLPLRSEEARRTPAGFAVTSTRQRVITTSILLLLVSTVIPYQFAYLVLCLVQLATCIRAWRLTLDTNSDTNYNFYNYAHSLLVLMLWILPINMPVLVVWIRNLAVHWLTPFSSHHNILSIMPYILLVETLSTGRMVPRLSSNSSGSGNGGSSGKGTTSTLAYVTNTAFFVLAMWAAVFGVSYAYQLHHFVNGICAWLVLVHLSTSKALRSLYL